MLLNRRATVKEPFALYLHKVQLLFKKTVLILNYTLRFISKILGFEINYICFYIYLLSFSLDMTFVAKKSQTDTYVPFYFFQCKNLVKVK